MNDKLKALFNMVLEAIEKERTGNNIEEAKCDLEKWYNHGKQIGRLEGYAEVLGMINKLRQS